MSGGSKVVGRGVGAAELVGGRGEQLVGLIEQLGLDRAVQRRELGDGPAHGRELLGEAGVIGQRGSAERVERLDAELAQHLGGAVGDVLPYDDG